VVCEWFSTAIWVQGQNGEGIMIPTSNLVPLDARVNVPSSGCKAISNHLKSLQNKKICCKHLQPFTLKTFANVEKHLQTFTKVQLKSF
jgi:hypothetical protein